MTPNTSFDHQTIREIIGRQTTREATLAVSFGYTKTMTSAGTNPLPFDWWFVVPIRRVAWWPSTWLLRTQHWPKD